MRQLLDTEGGLTDILERINHGRRALAEQGDAGRHAGMEEAIESLFHCSRQLAVYGTLAPGKANQAMLDACPGQWLEGCVRGQLHYAGWGAPLGSPAMIWDVRGEPLAVKLLISAHLPDHWTHLDSFEGEQYVRILVPVEDASGIFAVANLYALRS